MADAQDSMPEGPFKIAKPPRLRTPVIAHIPHASTVVPPSVRQQIVLDDEELHREIVRLTDWHVDRLFSWVLGLGGCMFVNTLSRLVFDPERFADDDDEERKTRVRELYEPYHERLTALVARTVQRFGMAFLLDCHSFGRRAHVCIRGAGPFGAARQPLRGHARSATLPRS
jgi:N-formylglutamate deformylase